MLVFRRSSSRCRTARRRTAAFSVVELLIVMAIIGVLAALVVPSVMVWLKRLRLEGTVKNAAGVIQQARARAVRTGVPVVIVPEPSADHNAAGDYLMVWEVEDYWTNPSSLKFGIDGEVVTELPLAWSGAPDSTVHFWTADETDPDTGAFQVDFTENKDATTKADYPFVIVFDPDGTIRDPGKLRFGMGSTGGGGSVNHLEIEVSKAGNLKIKKYLVSEGEYDIKRQKSGGGINWEWY